MAKKKEERKYELYWDRITVARRFYEQKRESHIKKWNSIYRGDWFNSAIPVNDQIFVNYTYSTVKNKAAALYYKNPKIIIEARRPVMLRQGIEIDVVINAKNMEEVANYQMVEYKIAKQIRKAIVDWLRFGYGVIFTGWLTEFEYESKTEKNKNFKLESAKKTFKVSPSKNKEIKTDKIASLIADRPDIKRKKVDKVYFSPTSEDDDDVYNNYVVLVETMAWEDVQNNDEFKNVKAIPTSSWNYSDFRGEGGESTGDTEDMKRIKIYHYYDRDRYIVMADGMKDKNLIDNPNPYREVFGEEEALPVVMLFGDDDNENFYPLSDISMYEEQQNELNEIRSQQSNHRKRFNRKYLYDRNKIDSDQLDEIISGMDGAVCGINADGQNLNSFISPLEDARLDYPFQMETRVVEDINIISGVYQYQRGSSQGQPDTLGQTQISEAHSLSRRDEEQRKIEEFATDVYRRLCQLNKAFLQDTVYTKVIGEEGGESYEQYTKEDIQGEFEYKVESGSSIKQNDDVIRKQTLDAFNLLFGIAETGKIRKDLIMSVMDVFPAMKPVADKFKKIPVEELLPPPEPEVKKSITMNLDKLFPMLPKQIQYNILRKYGIKVSPDRQQYDLPNELQGENVALDQDAFSRGPSTQGALNQGANQLLR